MRLDPRTQRGKAPLEHSRLAKECFEQAVLDGVMLNGAPAAAFSLSACFCARTNLGGPEEPPFETWRSGCCSSLSGLRPGLGWGVFVLVERSGGRPTLPLGYRRGPPC